MSAGLIPAVNALLSDGPLDQPDRIEAVSGQGQPALAELPEQRLWPRLEPGEHHPAVSSAGAEPQVLLLQDDGHLAPARQLPAGHHARVAAADDDGVRRLWGALLRQDFLAGIVPPEWLLGVGAGERRHAMELTLDFELSTWVIAADTSAGVRSASMSRSLPRPR